MDDFEFKGYPPELLSAFQLPEEHPVRQGILYVLNEATKGEAIGAAAPGQNDADRHWHAGRLAMIQDLFFGFDNLFKDANNEKPEQAP